ncbi:hypothetical protein CONCODRAFT_5489 [Conidiobolus coronatus NRRL 28638]|uniref:AA1-like domain-containing protein n=1 Tax=Conidiobolus coronatus (strain ATCC 28846 / CBS 209.66 / NRRL 28638) TaxID=796925 RepID=A0A137P9V8_CONC2|nr:hypothetical protein CONCODRAFT_5489 [Conidiobolus coronatus NRRL 28638]|eukprot:KXN71779.1 hypothetical protein CONCODRAFT_5489 [Conidiobolus coronatus NRRL 28638]
MKFLSLFISTISCATITLTDSSNGSISAKLNDVIIVRLSGSGNANPSNVWTAPTSSNPSAVKSVFSSATYDGGAQAFFTVSASGSSTISAQNACKPAPGKICNFAIRLWSVNINAS